MTAINTVSTWKDALSAYWALTNVYSCLPPTMYALEGRQCAIYYSNFLRTSFPLGDYSFTVNCTKGEQHNTRWFYTPTAADAGNLPWSMDIYWNGVLVATVSTTIVIKPLSVGNGITRKMVIIGDSTTANGTMLVELVNLFVNNTASQGQISSLTSSGTTATGISLVPHGMSTGNTVTIAGATPSGYNLTATVTVTGPTTFTYTLGGTLSSPATGTITYNLGADVMTLTPVGSIPVTANDALGNSRTVRMDAIGGKSINFFYTDPTSQFVFSGAFNFAQYLSTNSITLSSGDWVNIILGINDIAFFATDAALSAQMATMVTQLNAMIANIKAAVPGIRIGLYMTIPPCLQQDPFGVISGTSLTQWRYARNRYLWCEMMMATYPGALSNVYLFPYHLNLDTINNMPTSLAPINARNTANYTEQTNSVHPANSGYWQMADSMKCFLKGLES